MQIKRLGNIFRTHGTTKKGRGFIYREFVQLNSPTLPSSKAEETVPQGSLHLAPAEHLVSLSSGTETKDPLCKHVNFALKCQQLLNVCIAVQSILHTC